MKNQLFIYGSLLILVYLLFDLAYLNIIPDQLIIILGVNLVLFNIIIFRLFTLRVNNEKQYLKNQAMHDGMTGLLNYKFFDKRLEEEIERSNRYNEKITLLFMDLDKFKRINDTYGHQFGDQVLKRTSEIIKGNVRNIDIVSRYGGEEFCVILINANKDGSINTAERIRKEMEDNIFIINNKKENVTISIGMAEFPIDSNNKNDLIKYADNMMYNAKESGRNCIR